MLWQKMGHCDNLKIWLHRTQQDSASSVAFLDLIWRLLAYPALNWIVEVFRVAPIV
jgi:hypothetical protein